MTELLAPAGGPEALRAAVYAGADAVYFGVGRFNARADASNFDMSSAADALSFCRLHNVKAHVTLNTLLSSRELREALQTVDALVSLGGPDAFIVQDMALADMIKSKYPSLPLHASTQMAFHSSNAVPFLRRHGFTRLVIARETSLEDIKSIVKAGMETEIFIHGALCVCQSGGCLMSSFIGKRSGNRGECAQPCRLPCRDAEMRYPLSMKDLCLASHIPEILESGVTSLKIEGRMKSPEYVYTVTGIYRSLIDGRRNATQAELEQLEKAFSRSGFTDGYFTGSTGKRMFGIRTEADKTLTRAFSPVITPRKIPVEFRLEFRRGKSAHLAAVTDDGIHVQAEGAVPEESLSRPADERALRERFSKTGHTEFWVRSMEISLDDGLFMPFNLQNELKNKTLELLRDEICRTRAHIYEAADDKTSKSEQLISARHKIRRGSKGFVFRFENRAPSRQISEKLEPLAERIDVPLWALPPEGAICDAAKYSAVLPRVVFDSDVPSVTRLLERAKAAGINRLTLPSAALLPLCGGFGHLHGDLLLNVYNPRTAEILAGEGFESVFISPEAKLAWFSEMNAAAREILFYGKAPVMHTENCIIKNVTGRCPSAAERSDEASERCRGVLTDRTGARFPILREYKHRNTIYNSAPTCLFDKMPALEGKAELLCFIFTDESEREILSAVESALRGENRLDSYTRMYI